MERPLLTTNGDGLYWLTRPLNFYDAATLTHVHVPRGFATDLASVPRLFWNLLAPTGLYARAAVIHDFLYRTEGLHGEVSRAQSDRIFRLVMQLSGVPGLERWIIFSAVRLFGWIAWDGHRRRH